MSCCGKKREQLKQLHRMANSNSSGAPSAGIWKMERRESRVFEYTGSGSLNISGISSGIRYRFLTHGSRITVAYEDSFAMMAEADLKIVG